MAATKKNIYAKLADARQEFHAIKLTKSGKNDFAGYRYFELGDFLVPGMNVMREAGLVPVVSFESSRAVMRIFETDGDGVIEIESPRAAANLKGCHPVQNLGAEETYQRRYLWMAALEIVEHDAVDASQGAAPPERITESQLADLESLIEDVGADPVKFMSFLKVNDLAELTADRYAVAVDALERKRAA